MSATEVITSCISCLYFGVGWVKWNKCLTQHFPCDVTFVICFIHVKYIIAYFPLESGLDLLIKVVRQRRRRRHVQTFADILNDSVDSVTYIQHCLSGAQMAFMSLCEANSTAQVLGSAQCCPSCYQAIRFV